MRREEQTLNFKKLILCLLLVATAFGRTWSMKPPLGTRLDTGLDLSKHCKLCLLMNEGGGNRINDLSGNRNYGVFSGDMSWVSGKFGPVLKGLGDTDSILLSSEITLTTSQSWSVYFWANQESGAGFSGMVAGDVDSTDDYIWFYPGNYIRVRCANQSSEWTEYTDFTGWHQYTITSDGTNLKAYRDAVYLSNKTPAATSLKIDSLFAGHSTRSFDFKGKLDHFIVFNKELTAGEIKQLYIDSFCMVYARPIYMYYAPAAGGQVIWIN